MHLLLRLNVASMAMKMLDKNTNVVISDQHVAVARRFLDALYSDYPGEQIEFRLIAGARTSTSPVIRIFADLPVPDEIFGKLITWNKAGYNVYYGVATRRDNKPWFVPAVWVDIDYKNMKPRLISPEALVILRLQSGSIPPDLIVKSGHGIHAYWRTSGGPADHPRIKEINKRLAKLYGGDSVSDIGRVLRLPGFYNFKDVKNPQLCQVSENVDWGTIKVKDLEELESWLNEVPVPRLSKQIENLITNGAPVGKRSEADFAVMAGMLEQGFSPSEIMEVFENNKIGDKAREKGVYKEDYLSRTLRAAQQRLKGGKQNA